MCAGRAGFCSSSPGAVVSSIPARLVQGVIGCSFERKCPAVNGMAKLIYKSNIYIYVCMYACMHVMYIYIYIMHNNSWVYARYIMTRIYIYIFLIIDIIWIDKPAPPCLSCNLIIFSLAVISMVYPRHDTKVVPGYTQHALSMISGLLFGIFVGLAIVYNNCILSINIYK